MSIYFAQIRKAKVRSYFRNAKHFANAADFLLITTKNPLLCNMTDQSKNALAWRLELIFWLFTAIVVVGVLYPIVSKLEHYRFLFENVLFIIIFITFARYIFLLKHTFLAKRQRLKFAVAVACLPILLWVVNSVNAFQTFLDENGPIALVGELPLQQATSMVSYIRSEMIFFGTAAGISTVLLAIRLLVSIWTWRNRGRV